jgi:hypothetical protein
MPTTGRIVNEATIEIQQEHPLPGTPPPPPLLAYRSIQSLNLLIGLVPSQFQASSKIYLPPEKFTAERYYQVEAGSGSHHMLPAYI